MLHIVIFWFYSAQQRALHAQHGISIVALFTFFIEQQPQHLLIRKVNVISLQVCSFLFLSSRKEIWEESFLVCISKTWYCLLAYLHAIWSSVKFWSSILSSGGLKSALETESCICFMSVVSWPFFPALFGMVEDFKGFAYGEFGSTWNLKPEKIVRWL